MTTLTIQPPVGMDNCYSLAATDYGANLAKLFADIADLVRLNNAIAQLDEDTLACDLQRFFDMPDFDKARNLRVWQDARGKLIGFGQLILSQLNNGIEGYLYFDVHPTWRSHNLETDILQWSEARLREVGTEQGLPVKLRTHCCEDRFRRMVLLEKQGFTTERLFLTMACSLNQPLCLPSLPSGFTLQPLLHQPPCDRAKCSAKGGNLGPCASTSKSNELQCNCPKGSAKGDRELKAWVELFNESFIDHWNHHDLTVETARYWLIDNPHCKPELNLIAVAPDGTLAAFCVGYINQGENARTGRNEGWIKLLGTRRGFRKLGLGRAMLLAQMTQLKAAGAEQVKLGVDVQSLTSATRLYQSVAFQPIKTWYTYVNTKY